MRACEADRCEAGATVGGRWCERHSVVVTIERPDDDPLVLRCEGEQAETMTALASALEADSEPDPVERRRFELVRRWSDLTITIADAEEDLANARAWRVEVLKDMRHLGMSLGDIAEVTGLTRQRIGQLLKD